MCHSRRTAHPLDSCILRDESTKPLHYKQPGGLGQPRTRDARVRLALLLRPQTFSLAAVTFHFLFLFLHLSVSTDDTRRASAWSRNDAAVGGGVKMPLRASDAQRRTQLTHARDEALDARAVPLHERRLPRHLAGHLRELLLNLMRTPNRLLLACR